MFVRHLVIAVLSAVGCAHPAARPVADSPQELPPDHTRHYTIWLGGARVGTATESERWTSRGMTLARNESMRFLRGDAEVSLATSIIIDATIGLSAQRVRWSERGTETREAEAVRSGDGWQLSTGERLTMPAVPAELVPLLVRRDGSFSGPVFLPARGFVTGAGHIEPIADKRLVARIALDAGPLVEATIDLDPDGTPARIVDGEGVIAIRATEHQAREPFEAVDLIAATAIPITGTRGRIATIALDGDIALPPLPGQRAVAGDGIALELDAQLPGALPAGASSRDRTRDIAALVAAVQQRVRPDLAITPAMSRDAHAAAGDCTTFALAYAALATEQRIPTRVVTGLRVDDNERLIRHRWAVSWTGTRWIAIDAAFGRAPAGGNLIGLAVHDADDAGLVAGEAALTLVRGATWR